jgi:hypothetical protein
MKKVAMGNVRHIGAFESLPKNTGKFNLQPISNIELFPIHIESKLGLLSVDRKLVKDVLHPWKGEFRKK